MLTLLLSNWQSMKKWAKNRKTFSYKLTGCFGEPSSDLLQRTQVIISKIQLHFIAWRKNTCFVKIKNGLTLISSESEKCELSNIHLKYWKIQSKNLEYWNRYWTFEKCRSKYPKCRFNVDVFWEYWRIYLIYWIHHNFARECQFMQYCLISFACILWILKMRDTLDVLTNQYNIQL